MYDFRRGETITLALDAIAGDPALITAVSAAMRPAGRDGAATLFTVTPRAALASQPAGWNLVITADVSSGLPAGAYKADARLTAQGGAVVYADPVELRLIEPVTE